jgi:antitoxin (DNA-binding transcriptional repressor) of toxin-antitoxin stability system
MTVNIRMLRSSTREILSAVSRGDTVFIANRGKACAKIIPIGGQAAAKPVSLAGMWKDNKKTASVGAFIRVLREPRHAR